MASEPVTMTSDREVWILRRRVQNIAEEVRDLGAVLVQPVVIEPSDLLALLRTTVSKIILGNDSGTREEVAIVKMVIVVKAIALVDMCVSCSLL